MTIQERRDGPPRKRAIGARIPPSKEYRVFTVTLQTVRQTIEGLAMPSTHPVVGRLVELFWGNTTKTDGSPTPDPKPGKRRIA